VIALVLVLPTVLLAGWMTMWLVHKPLRWLWYFGGGFALMLLIVAGRGRRRDRLTRAAS
jgi:bacteriorhodopsin